MDLKLTLSDVEVDALTLAFETRDIEAAIHRALMPIIERTSEARLQRLATVYRGLSPADQFEASVVLAKWRATKEADGVSIPALEPAADAILSKEQ